MADKLYLLGGFAALMAALWATSMRLTPHRGLLRGLEKLCAGIILCYCLALLLRPLGVAFPQGPMASAFAGALGLPGAALAFFVGNGL